MKRGWTLPELLISMSILGLVVGLAAHAAAGQLRFFRGIGEVAGTRSQVSEAAWIVSSALRDATPSSIRLALDSALEIDATKAVGVVCETTEGRVVMALGEKSGNTLASLDDLPEVGDVGALFVSDSLGSGWIALTVAGPPVTTGVCAGFPAAPRSLAFPVREPIIVPAGSVLRFARPLRLSVYRSSDGNWYIGMKDWNTALQRFNSVQPVAGPLLAYNRNEARSGLVFRYYDAAGAELDDPVAPGAVRRVALTVRGRSTRPVTMPVIGSSTAGPFEDSLTLSIALRPAR